MDCEKKEIKRVEYVISLTESEYKGLKWCIDYCVHRAEKHKTPVTDFSEFLERFQNMLCSVK